MKSDKWGTGFSLEGIGKFTIEVDFDEKFKESSDEIKESVQKHCYRAIERLFKVVDDRN